MTVAILPVGKSKRVTALEAALKSVGIEWKPASQR